MGTKDKFIEFKFFDNVNPDTLEYIFETAWDTLKALHPDKKLDACDCYSIYTIPDSTYEDGECNYDLIYVTGLINDKPALQNLGTKEIIPIDLNTERWYDNMKNINLYKNFIR